jgi:hypothetical protein
MRKKQRNLNAERFTSRHIPSLQTSIDNGITGSKSLMRRPSTSLRFYLSDTNRAAVKPISSMKRVSVHISIGHLNVNTPQQLGHLLKTCGACFEPEVLARCMGVNAIFLRSPNIADYNRNVDRQTRAQVAHFCKTRVLQIIDVVDPDKIVVIGFSTLKLFGPTEPDLINDKGRILTRTGTIGDRKAVAMLHLSGAYISNADRDCIRNSVLAN